MPGLKFRILLDSKDKQEVFRDILIKDTDNFESFFNAIIQSFNLSGKEMASFYVSNDNWDKGQEISLLDLNFGDEVQNSSPIMKNSIIKDFIEEPDQKFLFIYDFLNMWIFLVELIGYENNEPQIPELILSIGEAPTEKNNDELADLLLEGENLLESKTNSEIDIESIDENSFNEDFSDFNEFDY
tara:strand:- start:1361 stop:1915 length:555 start_codon:yes stop_codon:yes gene_type:complete